MRYRGRAAVLWLSAILMVVVAGCGGKGNQVAPTGGSNQTATTPQPTVAADKVVIYTSMYQHVIDDMSQALKVKMPNREVEFVTKGGTEHLIAKVESENNAGLAFADIIMLADPAYTRILKNQGRLLPYQPQGLEKVLVDKDSQGHHFGVRVLDVVLIYNTDLVSPADAPKSFKELLEPKWQGQVALPDPTKSGTAMVTVGALIQKYGWEYWERAEKNGWQFGGGSSAAPKNVADGKVKVAVAIEENYLTLKAEDKKVGMVWPEEGAIVVESPFAILKDAPNPTGAKAVADWLLTTEAQGILARGGMHPVIGGIAPPRGSVAVTELLEKGLRVDWDRFAREKDDVQRRISGVITIKGA